MQVQYLSLSLSLPFSQIPNSLNSGKAEEEKQQQMELRCMQSETICSENLRSRLQS